jgi:hypothetical protein
MEGIVLYTAHRGRGGVREMMTILDRVVIPIVFHSGILTTLYYIATQIFMV